MPIIHLVEDTAVQRKTYQRQLENLGLTVVAHKNAEEFLTYIQDNTNVLQDAAAVITDYNMGTMNGGELVEALRKQEGRLGLPPLCIIGMSAEENSYSHSGDNVLGEFKRMGADDAVNKDDIKNQDQWKSLLERNGILTDLLSKYSVRQRGDSITSRTYASDETIGRRKSILEVEQELLEIEPELELPKAKPFSCCRWVTKNVQFLLGRLSPSSVSPER